MVLEESVAGGGVCSGGGFSEFRVRGEGGGGVCGEEIGGEGTGGGIC